MFKVGLALADLDILLIPVGKIEKMDKDRPPARASDTERIFGEDVQSQILYNRQYVREHNGGIWRIQSELSLVGGIAVRLVQCDLEMRLGICCHHMNKIIDPLGWGELLSKGGGETLTPFIRPRQSLTLSMSILKQDAQFIWPGARQFLNLRFDLFCLRRDRSQGVYADKVMDACQYGFREIHIEFVGLPTVGSPKRVANLLP